MAGFDIIGICLKNMSSLLVFNDLTGGNTMLSQVFRYLHVSMVGRSSKV